MPVKDVTISFPASQSPDVVGYKLYVEEAPTPVTYNSEAVDLGSETTVDLSTVSGMSTKDGTYNIGITVIDDAGNESSMSIANDIALDFVEPDPPGLITVTRA